MIVSLCNSILPLLYYRIYIISVVRNERVYIIGWYCSEQEHHENYTCAYFTKKCSQVEKVHILFAITVPKVKENLKIILIAFMAPTYCGFCLIGVQGISFSHLIISVLSRSIYLCSLEIKL